MGQLIARQYFASLFGISFQFWFSLIICKYETYTHSYSPVPLLRVLLLGYEPAETLSALLTAGRFADCGQRYRPRDQTVSDVSGRTAVPLEVHQIADTSAWILPLRTTYEVGELGSNLAHQTAHFVQPNALLWVFFNLSLQTHLEGYQKHIYQKSHNKT